MVSEDNGMCIEVPEGSYGKYILVSFGPLEGFTNINCLVSKGSIKDLFVESDKRAILVFLLISGLYLL